MSSDLPAASDDPFPAWFARRWRNVGVKAGSVGIHTQVDDTLLRCMRRSIWCLVAVLDGRIAFDHGSQRVDLLANSLSVFPPDSGFVGHSDEAVRLLLVDFSVLSSVGWTDPLAELPLPRAVAWSSSLPLVELAERIREGHRDWHADDTAANLRARAYLDLLLTEFLRSGFASGVLRGAGGGMPGWVRDLLSYLDANMRRHDVGLDELAAQCGFSRSHVSHEFKRFVGQGPLAYLQRERIAMAARLLASSPERPVAEIAERCGYADPALFSRHFRKQTGRSPTAWRQGGAPDAG